MDGKPRDGIIWTSRSEGICRCEGFVLPYIQMYPGEALARYSLNQSLMEQFPQLVD